MTGFVFIGEVLVCIGAVCVLLWELNMRLNHAVPALYIATGPPTLGSRVQENFITLHFLSF